jgi:hypothetical protein
METSHSNYFDSGPKIGLVLTILVPDTAETKILLLGKFDPTDSYVSIDNIRLSQY